MSVRVSVVVAVYNTGEHIEPLIASLIRQTLSAADFEVIFVDDGSTDDTPARLDDLVASHENMCVLHEPNSGWPGRPRNLGIDRAVGEYVLFVDHDDWLGDEALARMADYADEHAADVLIGRYAGHRRGVAKALFDKSRPTATLADAPLMDSLTPHKLFRTEFLRDHDLRFPEGRRRLEDHVFVVRAYFLAQRIAVLADYHCYFHIGRQDAGNAGYQRIDPSSYYRYVREVIDIIETFTEPQSSLRERCLRRPLRQEVLARLDGRSFLAQDQSYQRTLFDEARALVLERVPPAVDAGLSPPQRVRAFLLREGRFADLITYVQHQVGVHAAVELVDLHWVDDRLRIGLTGRLEDRQTGSHVHYERGPGGSEITVPPLSGPVPHDRRAAAPGAARLGLLARRRADSEEWPVTPETVVDEHVDGDTLWVEAAAGATLDPRTLGGGRPLTRGIWDLYATVSQTGWSKETRLGAIRTRPATDGCVPAILGDVVFMPYWTETYDNLSLQVAASPKAVSSRYGARVEDCSVVSTPGAAQLRIRVPLHLMTAHPSASIVRLVRLTRRPRTLTLAGATTIESDERVTVSVPLPRRRGRWAVWVQPGSPAWGPPHPTGAMVVALRSDAPAVQPAPAFEPVTPGRRLDTVRARTVRFARRVRRRIGAT